MITCDDGAVYHYVFVSEDNPRYTGNPDRAIWGNWETVVETWSGTGNVANPQHPSYAYAG